MEPTNQPTDILIKQITDQFLATLKQQVTKQVTDNVAYQMSRLDVATLAREHISSVLNANTKTYNFPDRSIKGNSINPDGLFIKADQIAAGVMRNFESTGIQDKADSTQVTIMDNATVFENKLVAKELHVAGVATIEGDLSITGTVTKDSKLFQDVAEHSLAALRDDMRGGVLSNFRDEVFEKIQTEGISADVIKYQNQRLVRDNTLAPTILNSNLQTVGALKELQVIGETLLDETLYISTNRIGINTMEPETTFDLWDQEVRISMGKLEKDFAFFGMKRAQGMIIGSNRNYNLAINPDGTVTINYLKIGGTTHSSAEAMPSHSDNRGSIVWNSNPNIGDPIGWVCLGGARWAHFGTITA